MSLHEQLDAFRFEFARTAPTECPALHDDKAEALRASFPTKTAVPIEDDASHFSPPDGRVALAHVEVDYRTRLEPDAILAASKSFRPA